MDYEFFRDGLLLFDKYTFSKEKNFETISGVYKLNRVVNEIVYLAKFKIVVIINTKDKNDIPVVYLPKIVKPKGFSHIYQDDRCCLGLNYEIGLLWNKNRTFVNFLLNIVDPFLVNYLSYNESKTYINGDRPHAQSGVIDYYSKFFPTIPLENINNTLIYCFDRVSRKEFVRGNNPCPCGSGKIIRRCLHKKELESFVNLASSTTQLRSAFLKDMKNIGGHNAQI